MDDRQQVAWLHRRAGFGLHPTELDVAAGRKANEELAGFAEANLLADPWDGVELDPELGGRRAAVGAWLRHLLDTSTPYIDRRTWMLHGWLVSSLAKVNLPDLMVDQIRLLERDGGGRYPDLLRAITIDRAMLVYLDGRTSTAEAPNENYGRELLELFSLGVGNYEEDDVLAAARALTGWVVGRELPSSRLIPFRHDDTPQTLLGSDGVDDVDSVIDAVIGSPAHADFVARRIVREYLGDDLTLTDAVAELTEVYIDNDLHLDPVIFRALELGLDGTATPIVLAPVPWFVIVARATGFHRSAALPRLTRSITDGFVEMGQIPLVPPDVSGWPGGEAWFTASSLIARANVAAALADATPPDEPVRVAIDDGDLDLVALQLGLPDSFTSATTSAIDAETDPVNRLTLALVSPENLLS